MGISELLVIAAVLLLVVGPEKLPETVRSITIHMSKIKRYWQVAKREIEQELGVDEVRREIHNAQVMEQLEAAKQKLKQPVDEHLLAEEEGNVISKLMTEQATPIDTGTPTPSDDTPTRAPDPVSKNHE